jgi:hypothetical protein
MKNKVAFLNVKSQRFVENHGVTMDEVQRQWSLLTGKPKRIVLDRPCTIDDGIEQLLENDWPALTATHRAAADQGRWTKFVPASGAASRMFALKSREDQKRFCRSIDRLAFAGQLEDQLLQKGIDLASLIRAQKHEEVIQAIVSRSGLDYGQIPKGLLGFHSYRGSARSAFEEHLFEAVACLGTCNGDIQAHFTVGANSQDEFVTQLQRFRMEMDEASCQVSFSVQSASTDTIALAEEGGILLSDSGHPIFRPGGHGALVENLNSIQGDLIFVKNIDNVAHEHSRETSITWIQILGGYLVRLREAVHQHVRALKSGVPSAINAAFDFVQLTFPNVAAELKSENPNEMRSALLSRLNRPLRICGMVENEGEPGGGPFWVRDVDGSDSVQIVESAEIDRDDASQGAIFSQATHFNPVFTALSVRDERGQPFDLWDFVNQDRVIRATKQVAGQTATVLERPGLWNGGMAGWNSVFVEVPMGVLSPVKSVLDLLRPEHQPVRSRDAGRAIMQ